MHRLSIIIPCYNEARTLPRVLERVASVSLPGWEREIIVVDDGSVDGTGALFGSLRKAHPSAVFLSHERNLGKGAAVRTALSRATGDAVLIQDADEEYEPQDIPALTTEYAKSGGAVFGSRNLGHNHRSSRLFYYGGLAVTAVANALYGLRLTDMPTGYKLMARGDLARMDLRSRRFEFCAEVTAKLARLGVPIREVPISYAPRSREEGKKIRVSDGFHAVAALCAFRAWRPSRSWNAIDRWIRELRVRRALPFIGSGDKVLDVGCGQDAYLYRRLGLDDVEYVGFDAEADAARLSPRASVVRGGVGSRLPFDDGAFTRIVSLASLEHLDDPQAFFREARRVLAPGGMLVLTTPSGAAKPVLETLAALRIVNREEIAEHKRYFDKDDLFALSRGAGFAKADHRPFECGLNQLLICEG